LVLIISEVESFVLSQAQAVPDGVRFGFNGGLGIMFLTDAGNRLLFARTTPEYTADIIGGVDGNPFRAE
jgi:hypothetical protein